MPVAAGTFVLGALPWLWTNAGTGLASLQSASSPSYQASTYGGRLHLFLDKSLPMMLGLRVPVTGAWLDGRVGQVAFVVAALAVVAACALGIARCRRPGREVHVGCCVATLAFPFAYSTFPATTFWQDGHYAVFVVPLVVLTLVGCAPADMTQARHRTVRPALLPAAAIALAAVMTATTALTFDDQFLGGHPTAFWRQSDHPNAVATQAASALGRDGVRTGYADYWTAYDLDFLSGERLSIADPSADRWVAQYDRVRASPDPAWVFYDPASVAAATTAFGATTPGPFGYTEAAFLAKLAQLGVGYRIMHAGVLDAIVTARKIDQREVGMAGPYFGG